VKELGCRIVMHKRHASLYHDDAEIAVSVELGGTDEIVAKALVEGRLLQRASVAFSCCSHSFASDTERVFEGWRYSLEGSPLATLSQSPK
jgi:hypothetical protein